MEIDWSKAPEGATHSNREGTAFHHFGKGFHLHWLMNSWVIHGSKFEYYDIPGELVSRPIHWDGKGLPPVGTVVEFIKHNSPPAPEGQWIKGDVRYISDCTVVIGGEGCEHVHHPRNVSFRISRTPEQIAAELREKTVAKMEADIAKWGLTSDYNGMCQAMYDAGYRKFEITDES